MPITLNATGHSPTPSSVDTRDEAVTIVTMKNDLSHKESESKSKSKSSQSHSQSQSQSQSQSKSQSQSQSQNY